MQQYTVEAALSFSCEYNEAGAAALRFHGREYVEKLLERVFIEMFDGWEGADLNSVACSIVHPDDLFEPAEEATT